MGFPSITGSNFASTFFHPHSGGENTLFEFLTLTEANRLSEASRGCAAIALSFFEEKAENIRLATSVTSCGLSRELTILKNLFDETEVEVQRAFPNLPSEQGKLTKKQNASLAKSLFSKLSYPMSQLSYETKTSAPLVLSKKGGRATELIEEFIKASQYLETVEKFTPYFDSYIPSIQKFIVEKKAALASRERIFEENLPFIIAAFPQILQIMDLEEYEVFDTAPDQILQFFIREFYPHGEISEIDKKKLEIFITIMPVAILERVNHENSQIFVNYISEIIAYKFAINKYIHSIELWNTIRTLPSSTAEEIENKARTIANFIRTLTSLYPFPFELSKNRFTQNLLEIELLIQAHTSVERSLKLEYNSYRRVPLLPANIEVLSMNGNPLRSFENLGSLQNLHTLDLIDTGLKTLPPAVLEMLIGPRLRFVDLSDNNLTELPDSLDINDGTKRNIKISNNPIIYIPPRLLFNENLHIDTSKDELYLMVDMLDQGKSPLGKLYHYFARPTNSYYKEDSEKLLRMLSAADLNLIFERVWVESGKPQTADNQWGEHHTFDDLSILARAVRSAILEKLERLPKEAQYIAYHKIYELSGSPKNAPLTWGQDNAKYRLVRLADALSEEIGDTHSMVEQQSKKILYITGLYYTFQNIKTFHRWLPDSYRSDLKAKTLLFYSYKDLLRHRESSKEWLETREPEFPDLLASFEALLEEKLPDFCRGEYPLSERELRGWADS